MTEMRRCEMQLPWLRAVTVSQDDIVIGEPHGCGVGGVLMIEHAGTGALLMARKSARPGFEGNDQLAFPGGMVRARSPQHSLTEWILRSLHERVVAEVQLDLSTCEQVQMLAVNPPIVAAYTAKGQRRHTVLLPVTLTVSHDFQPHTQDPTVYDPGWYDPRLLWSDITPTNRLLAALYLWPRLTESERMVAQPSATEALEQASGWATEIGFLPPIAPWKMMNSSAC